MRVVIASAFRFVGGEKGVDRVALTFVGGGRGFMCWGLSMEAASPALIVADATFLVGAAYEAFALAALGEGLGGVADVAWPWARGDIAVRGWGVGAVSGAGGGVVVLAAGLALERW